MNFDIDDIPAGGLDFALDESRERFDIAGADCALTDDVHVEGRLSRIGPEVYLEGRVRTALQVSCARCLEPVRVAVDCELAARFLPAESGRKAHPETEMRSADADVEFYSENAIDITVPVHDHILLAMPQANLCSEECRGLCPACGVNLNQTTCRCERDEEIDPRLSVLKKLKDQLNHK